MSSTETVRITAATRLGALARSFRITTRLWFDWLVPTTMMLLIGPDALTLGAYLMAVMAVLFSHAGSTYLNDVQDVEVDRHSSENSRNERPLVRGRVTAREMAVVGWVLTLAGLVIAFLLPWPSKLAAAIAIPLALAYNFKPIHIAGRPLWTQVFWPAIWVLMFLFCAGAAQDGDWQQALPYLVFVVLFMGLGESLGQDIRDARNDAAGERMTTVVKYGVPKSAAWAWVFEACSVLAWGWLVFAYPLPRVTGLLALAVLVAWLVYSWPITRRLQGGFEPEAAKWTHLGPILTFTAVNALTVLGAILGV